MDGGEYFRSEAGRLGDVVPGFDTKSVENKLEEWRTALKEIRSGGGASGRVRDRGGIIVPT